jgi:hypothetical protein
MRVRCKLAVGQKTDYESPKGSAEVSLYAVYESRPDVNGQACEENRIFGDATPSASVRMLIKNPDAAIVFQPGKSFYVDFTPID